MGKNIVKVLINESTDRYIIVCIPSGIGCGQDKCCHTSNMPSLHRSQGPPFFKTCYYTRVLNKGIGQVYKCLYKIITGEDTLCCQEGGSLGKKWV